MHVFEPMKFLRVIMAFNIISTVGCSVFQPTQQHVTIIASDPSAQILVDNSPIGTGHVEINLDRNRSYAVLATSYGSSGTATIDKHISGTGVLDIIGGCFFLFPFIGCFTRGFWELSPTTVHVTVPPPRTNG